MRYNSAYIFVAAFVAILFGGSSHVEAADVPQSFTLDGRLFSDPAGTTPLLDGSITFTIQILDENKVCVLYEEAQPVSTIASKGYFSVQVGTIIGSTNRTSGDSANAMSTVFQNIGTINGKLLSNGSPCSIPGTATKRRYVRIKILPTTLGGVARTLAPDLNVDSVPNAIVAERAESLQGLRGTDVLQVNTTGGNTLSQSNLESLFTTSARFTELTSIINGTSGNYMRSNSASGAQLPALSGSPSSPPLGAVWYDTTASKVTVQTAGGPVALGTGGGSVSSVGFTAPGELSVSGAPVTSSGTIAVTWANQTTNKVFASPNGSTGAPSFRALVAADIPALTAYVGNAGGTPSLQSGLNGSKGAASTAGRVWISTDTKEIYRDNGATWDLLGSASAAPTGAAGGDLSGTYPNPGVQKIQGFLIDSTTPLDGQVLKYIGSATNKWTASNFSIGDLKTLGGAQQFAGSATCAATQTLTWSSLTNTFTCSNIAGLDAGVITTGTIAGARLPAGASAWTVTGNNISNTNTGNVGIGTTSPANALDVVTGAGTQVLATSTSAGGYAAVNLATDLGNLGGMWSPGSSGSAAQKGRVNYEANTSALGVNVTAMNATGDIRFQTGGFSERMRIDSAGNVGIGATAPSQLLTVAGTQANYLPGFSTATALNGALTNSETTITVASTAGYPASGILWIDSEAMTYTGLTSTTFTGVTRGYGFTFGQNHLSGAPVNASLLTLGSVFSSTIVTTDGSINSGFANSAIQTSLAIGSSNKAVGGYSVAIGSQNQVPGFNGFAAGNLNVVTSNFGTTFGTWLQNGSYGNFVVGQYNALNSGNPTTWVATDPIFEIGIGTGIGNKADAMTVLKNGNVGFGTTSPGSALDVKGTVRISGSTSGYVGLAVPAVAGAVTYTLPGADGSPGQLLSTNGSGTLAWAPATAGGVTSLGGLTAAAQTFAAGSSGTSPAIASTGAVHTLNVPQASGTGVTSGTISKVDYDNFVGKLTSPLTTKGDILTYSTTNARMPAGTDGQVLSSDATQSTGLKWITSPAGTVTAVTSTNAYLTVATGTTTPAVTANVGIVANTLAAGNDSRITGALQLSAYNNDVALAAGCTNVQTPYWNTVSDAWACQNINFSGAGFFVNGGNSLGAVATLGTNDNFALGLKTNNATRMTIDASGNVGVGTSTPTYMLDVNGAVRTQYLDIDDRVRHQVNANLAMVFYNTGSAATDAVGFTTRGASGGSPELILKSGNVGIGTTSPGNALEVNGNVAAVNANPVFFFGPSNGAANTTNYHSLGYAAANGYHVTTSALGDLTIAARPNGGILFGTNNTTAQPSGRMYINSVGSVGIGTTTPNESLHVVGNIKVQGQAYSAAQSSSATSPLLFDANLGNVMSWAAGSQTNVTVNINNAKDGGSYTLAIRGSATGSTTINCYSDGGSTALTNSFMPSNADRATTASLYTILRVGNYCYISWSTGWP